MVELFKKKSEVVTPIMSQKEGNGEATRRIRILEERNANLNRKVELIERNLIEFNKKENQEIKTINAEIIEMQKQISVIKNNVSLIVRELQLTAKKDEFNSLKKYVEVWDPVEFVTRNEVKNLIKDHIEAREELIR